MSEKEIHSAKRSKSDELFQVDASSIDQKEALSPDFPIKSLRESKKKDSRWEDYIVKENEELFTLTCLEENPLQIVFDEDKSLIVKRKTNCPITNDNFTVLKQLTDKFSQYNSSQKQNEPSSYLRWFYAKISRLFKSAKQPKHLSITKIVINLSDCEEMGNEGLEYLIEFVKTFENLTYLEMEVKNSKATDYSLGLVCSLLQTLKNLTYIYLDFSGCTLSDEGIFFLANTLKTKTEIEEVWLRFSWCVNNAITNEGLQMLAKALDAIKKLRVLLLEMNGQSQISSKGLSGVLTAIKEKKSLQRLYLYFENSQVNDNFLGYAGENLPRMKNLEVLGLNLSNSNFLTMKGLEKLEGGLNKSSLRTGLYLYFNGCLGMLEREKMKECVEKLIKTKKIKNYVIEFL